MGKVINLQAYRFYNMVKSYLERDGIKCRFKYDDSTYVEWVTKFSENKISWGEFYTGVGSYAMSLEAIISG